MLYRENGRIYTQGCFGGGKSPKVRSGIEIDSNLLDQTGRKIANDSRLLSSGSKMLVTMLVAEKHAEIKSGRISLDGAYEHAVMLALSVK